MRKCTALMPASSPSAAAANSLTRRAAREPGCIVRRGPTPGAQHAWPATPTPRDLEHDHPSYGAHHDLGRRGQVANVGHVELHSIGVHVDDVALYSSGRRMRARRQMSGAVPVDGASRIGSASFRMGAPGPPAAGRAGAARPPTGVVAAGLRRPCGYPAVWLVSWVGGLHRGGACPAAQSVIGQVAADGISRSVTRTDVEFRFAPGQHPAGETVILDGPRTRSAGWCRARGIIRSKAQDWAGVPLPG